jgi:hypothetical protein
MPFSSIVFIRTLREQKTGGFWPRSTVLRHA